MCCATSSPRGLTFPAGRRSVIPDREHRLGPRKRATGAPGAGPRGRRGQRRRLCDALRPLRDAGYNYCLRLLTGGRCRRRHAGGVRGALRRLQADDAPVLDFAAYLYTAARNESYPVMRRRDRSRPTDSVPEEPGRAVAVETDPERWRSSAMPRRRCAPRMRDCATAPRGARAARGRRPLLRGDRSDPRHLGQRCRPAPLAREVEAPRRAEDRGGGLGHRHDRGLEAHSS